MSDDPFGRSRKDDEFDAFGNRIGRREDESLFHDPVPGSQPGEAPAGPFLPPEPPGPTPAAASPASSAWAPPASASPPGPGGFLPPSDAAPPPSTWQAPPAPPAPPARSATEPSWWAQHDSGRAAAASDTADWGRRAGAAVIDLIVRFVIVLPFALVGAAAAADTEAGANIGALIGGVVALAYAPLMMARTEGQTVGHKALGTRVVRTNGVPVDGGQATVREVVVKGLLIDGIGLFLTLGILPLVNYLWPLWDDRDEALHDKMCSTRVVDA